MNKSRMELSLEEMEQVNGGEALLIGTFIFAALVSVGACTYATVDAAQEQSEGGSSGGW